MVTVSQAVIDAINADRGMFPRLRFDEAGTERVLRTDAASFFSWVMTQGGTDLDALFAVFSQYQPQAATQIITELQDTIAGRINFAQVLQTREVSAESIYSQTFITPDMLPDQPLPEQPPTTPTSISGPSGFPIRTAARSSAGLGIALLAGLFLLSKRRR